MKKIIYLLLFMGIAQSVQSQNNNTAPGFPVMPDSAKTKIPFEDFWEYTAALGMGVNSEFIPQTENVFSPSFVFRIAKQHPKNIFGFGYDAQVIALKNMHSGTLMYNEKRNFGNPQHSFYGFADKIWRKNKVDIYLGVLAGFSFGKAANADSTTQFTMYESSKGYIVGGHLGLVYKTNKHWSCFLEFEPKIYGVNFNYKKSGASEKSADFRIKVLPVLIGFKYNLK